MEFTHGVYVPRQDRRTDKCSPHWQLHCTGDMKIKAPADLSEKKFKELNIKITEDFCGKQ